MLPKVIVMDLGETIINNMEIDFVKGLTFIYEKYCKKDIPLSELLNDNSLINNYCFKKRINDNFDVSFINYLNYIDKTIGFKENYSFAFLQNEFVDNTFSIKLMDNVISFLDEAKNQGIDLYILSNSMITSSGLKHQLQKLGVLDYFKEVFSSADFLLRKPSRIFFNVITKYLKRTYENLDLGDVWYIGNDYYFDVLPALENGLKSVWLNVEKHPNKEQVQCMEVYDYNYLCKYLKVVKK